MLNKLNDFWNKKWMFPIKAILFIFLTAGVPILAINHYFKLFYRTDDSQLIFTGWGAVAVIIFVLVMILILGYVIEAFSFRYSFWVKMAKYFKNIGIWLLVLIIVAKAIANNIDLFQPVLWWCFIGTCLGAIINPFPKWVFNQKVSDGGILAKKVFGGISVNVNNADQNQVATK